MTCPLERLQSALRDENLSAYILPHTASFFSPQGHVNSPAYFRYFSGFTGSAGVLVVTLTHVSLWVDGRYLLQAREEALAYEKKYPHMSVEVYFWDWTEIWSWIAAHVEESAVVGADAWLWTVSASRKLQEQARGHKMSVQWMKEVVAKTVMGGQETPPSSYSFGEIWFMEHALFPSFQEKCHKIFHTRVAPGRSVLLCHPFHSSWLLNMRSTENEPTFAVGGYALVTRQSEDTYVANVFVLESTKLAGDAAGITFHDVNRLWSMLKNWTGEAIFCHDAFTPLGFYEEFVSIGWQEQTFPFGEAQARKSMEEQGVLRTTHEVDSVALVRFLHWLSTCGSGSETEISLVKGLEAFRRQHPEYRGPSFPSISASGPHSAIIHYVPKEHERIPVEAGLYLLDSGGQYGGPTLFGTTDVTRTVWIGPEKPSPEHCQKFTAVLQAHIHLCTLFFPQQTTRGVHLDAAARSFLWQMGEDYAHSTGHGIGTFLSVHEALPSISSRDDGVPLQSGMVCSNEPGYYQEGWGGIRLENDVLVTEVTDRTFFPEPRGDSEKIPERLLGKLQLVPLTLVPFDVTLIAPHLLSVCHRKWLNEYHAEVYRRISPHVEGAVQEWLYHVTRPLEMPL